MGKEHTLDRPLDDFSELWLGKGLNYTLVSDTATFVRLKGGKNLLNLISTEVNNGILSIENGNKCNFLRNFDEIIEVEIHYINLNRVDAKCSHELVSIDTIKAEYFNLRLVHASGNAKLLVDTDFLNGFANDGSADYTFSGKTKVAHIQVYHNGFADVRNLVVQESLEITTRSSRRVLCHADGIPLKVTILGLGDVNYTGNPSSIDLVETSTGKLVKID